MAGNHWHNSEVMIALGPCAQLFAHENPKSCWGGIYIKPESRSPWISESMHHSSFVFERLIRLYCSCVHIYIQALADVETFVHKGTYRYIYIGVSCTWAWPTHESQILPQTCRGPLVEFGMLYQVLRRVEKIKLCERGIHKTMIEK